MMLGSCDKVTNFVLNFTEQYGLFNCMFWQYLNSFVSYIVQTTELEISPIDAKVKSVNLIEKLKQEKI